MTAQPLRRLHWVEPRCGVKFPETLETLESDPQGKPRSVDLPFLGGGIRAMLGNSALVDLQPCTRVYAFGLYVEHCDNAEDAALKFQDAVLSMEKFQGTRTLRLVAIIPKDGIHWARGFFASCLRYARSKELLRDKPRYEEVQKAILRFCELFADLGTIRPGSEFHFTWNQSGLLVSLDGKVLGRVKSHEVAKALFKIYFNHHDHEGLNLPAVNYQAAQQIAHQWSARSKIPDVLFPQDYTRKEFVAENQPTRDRCCLQGYQMSLGVDGGHASFDRVRARLRPSRGRGQNVDDTKSCPMSRPKEED